MKSKNVTSIDEVIIIYKVPFRHYNFNDPNFIEVEFDPGHNSKDDYIKTIEFDEETEIYTVTLRTGNVLTPPDSIKFKDDCKHKVTEILDINTSNLVNIDELCMEMGELTYVNIGSWFATSMSSMKKAFYKCPKLRAVHLENCDLQYMENMNEAFYGCKNLVLVDFGENTMPSLLDMEYAFGSCSNLTTIRNNWCLNYITNMNSAFSSCYNLEELDTTNWLKSPHNTINMNKTFYGNEALEVLDASSWDTSTVTSMTETFCGCNNLTTIIGQHNLNNVTDMTKTFKECNALVNIDVSNWGLNNVVTMVETFCNCTSLISIDTANWRLNNVDIINNVFKSCTSLISVGDISDWGMSNVTSIIDPFYETKITAIPTLNWNLSKLDRFSLFCGMKSLVSTGDLTVLDMSNVTSMINLFCYCESLEEIDLTGWDISKLQTIGSFCYQCYNLKRTKGLETWKPKELQSLSSMFAECYSLEEVNMSGWYCPKLHDLNSLFYSCEKLRTVDVTGLCCFSFDAFEDFDEENVNWFCYQNAECCFQGCYALENIIGLNTWIMSDMLEIGWMFEECYSLNENTIADIVNWDTSNIGSFDDLFAACPNLGYVDLSKWSLDGLYDNSNWWSFSDLFYMWYYDYDEDYAYCPAMFEPEDYNNIRPMTVDLSNLNLPTSPEYGQNFFEENYHINNLILKNQPASLVNDMIMYMLPDRVGMELSVGLIEIDDEIESEIDTEALEVLGWAIKRKPKAPTYVIMNKDIKASLYFKNKKAL